MMQLEELALQDYDDEHGLVRDEEGTQLEPFNLKKEREDGYFDAEGNYVEYRQENDARVSRGTGNAPRSTEKTKWCRKTV